MIAELGGRQSLVINREWPRSGSAMNFALEKHSCDRNVLI
jgi:hypothetical protein